MQFLYKMTRAISQKKRDKILGIHGKLLSAKSLEPSEKINSTFRELVGIVLDTPADHSKDILEDKEIRSIKNGLRKMSAKAETELELFWVKSALRSRDADKILRFFPYYSNYERMTDLEIESMRLCDIHDGHSVLFVGSGPLPLSSIMMARKCDALIDNLDMDDEACKLSQSLVNKSGLSERIRVIKGNILDMVNISKYQTIFIAALAGETDEEKKKIIDHIAGKSAVNTHIVMRSVSDLGTLLYPEITAEHLKNIDVVRRSGRSKDIINTIIVGKKK